MRAVVLLLVLCLSSVAVAGDRPVARTTDEVRRRMNEPIDVSLRETTLADAIDGLRRRLAVNLVVNWEDFELSGISPDGRLSFEVRGVPAGATLDLILGLGHPDIRKGWEIRGNTVLVATVHFLQQRKVTRIYDVNGLLGRTATRAAGPQRLVRLADTRARERLTAGDDPNSFVLEQRGIVLADLVRVTCEPDLWRELGAGDSSLTVIDGLFVVHAPANVQTRVQRLLLGLAHAWGRPAPLLYLVDEPGSDGRGG